MIITEVNDVTKMGRPKSEQPKDRKVAVRLSEEEFTKLRLFAEKNNLTMAQVLRKEILKLISDFE